MSWVCWSYLAPLLKNQNLPVVCGDNTLILGLRGPLRTQPHQHRFVAEPLVGCSVYIGEVAQTVSKTQVVCVLKSLQVVSCFVVNAAAQAMAKAAHAHVAFGPHRWLSDDGRVSKQGTQERCAEPSSAVEVRFANLAMRLPPDMQVYRTAQPVRYPLARSSLIAELKVWWFGSRASSMARVLIAFLVAHISVGVGRCLCHNGLDSGP